MHILEHSSGPEFSVYPANPEKPCTSQLSTAVIKHDDQGNLEKEGLFEIMVQKDENPSWREKQLIYLELQAQSRLSELGMIGSF